MQQSSRPPRARRKACDLCYRKKIKCDGTKPRCSHCLVYKSECTYEAESRKASRKGPGGNGRVESLEARLQFLEGRLRNFEEKAEDGNVNQAGDKPEPSIDRLGHVSQTSDPDEVVLGFSSTTQRHGGRPLPPLEEVLPVVEDYFANTNRLLPLFDETTFMKQLHEWHSSPAEQDPAIWAAINVVLALGKRHFNIDHTSRDTVDQYVRNAQSVLDRLVTREKDLLGLQVLLGLVMIFQGTSDPRPATVLISTAVRLAHMLRINTKKDDDFLYTSSTPEPPSQRDRVFWIMYILDRDISMRIKQPALQLEGDIGIDLPADTWDSSLGVVLSSSGNARLHYFRSRIQLAWIQGKVYDWLYSVKASKLPANEVEENRKRLDSMLKQWYSAIPEEFKPALLFESVDTTTFRCFTVLHFTHLHCMAMIHGSYSHNAPWLSTLRHYSRLVTDDQEANANRVRLPLPSNWTLILDRSRACMKLFTYMPQRDFSLVWLVACSYFTSVIFLTVNSLAHPDNSSLEVDEQLAENALEILGAVVLDSQNERLKLMRNACVELLENAKKRIALERAQKEIFAGSIETDTMLDFDPAIATIGQGFANYHPGFGDDSSGIIADLDTNFPGGWDQWLETRREVSTMQQSPFDGLAPGDGFGVGPNFDNVISDLVRTKWM